MNEKVQAAGGQPGSSQRVPLHPTVPRACTEQQALRQHNWERSSGYKAVGCSILEL